MNCNEYHTIYRAVDGGWICSARETRFDRLEVQRGLTVDEVMEVVMKWYNSPIDYNGADEPELRARLTAKLQDR